ncbi:MAG: pentapeptide repeat-containing protein [Planctomycetota bacterium]|nr:MAG: pentapeptide repeat-containing protein [Planctomycetota bacterium]
MSRRTPSPRSQPSPDELAIRWFTPRGREAVSELLEDLRHADGAHAAEIARPLRRPGAAPGAVDLRGIDLRDQDLGGARLSGADLRGARLERANLQAADLSGARLDDARLRGANLRGASLTRAVLDRALLDDADLSEANLEGASVSQASLLRTRLRRTWARGVDFRRVGPADADFSQVRREVYRPPAGARRRVPLGAPPRSEPRRPSERHAKVFARATAFHRATPALPLSTGSARFEEALAELLLSRDRVERIVVRIDGRDVVLYTDEEERRGLRAA